MRRHDPPATSGVRATAKTDEQDNLYRHSDPYGKASEDIQWGIATVTPGTASYRGASRTGAITTGTATYMGGSQAMSCHHRHSGLERREPEQKSTRLDSRIGATVMMTDVDQRREASEPPKSPTPKLKEKGRKQTNNKVMYESIKVEGRKENHKGNHRKNPRQLPQTERNCTVRKRRRARQTKAE